MPSRRLPSQAPQHYLELTEWDRGVPTDDGYAIWLLTILGVFQPAGIDVDETAEHVIISLYVRSLTPQPGEIISVPAIGRIASLAVPLSLPLAARRLLDGATGEPPPRRGVAIPEPPAPVVVPVGEEFDYDALAPRPWGYGPTTLPAPE